jgi:YegS/Rv2252/BmrU family lipid kinase
MRAQRTVSLVFNPHADGGRGWRTASSLQAVIERMGGAAWHATEFPTHATDLALQAARQGAQVVVAIGGDGTVHEVVNGLMQASPEQRPALGVVPIGSGNDFCANVGLPSDPESAILRAFEGNPVAVDIGRVQDESGRSEYWDNTLGIGFDAATTINSREISRLQGLAMYFVAVVRTILRDHNAPRLNLRIDQESSTRELLMLTACNGPREGGGFRVAPQADPRDGVLDFAMVEYVSRLTMFRLIPEFMRGTHGRFRQVHLGKFRHLELQSDRPLLIHTDGEIFASAKTDVRQLTIEVLPGALQVIA